MPTSTEILDALPVAVYMTDAEGVVTFFNQAAVDVWGQRPESGAKWCGSWQLRTWDGQPLPHEECPMAVCIKTGEPIRGVQAVIVRPDGTRVPVRPYPTPLRDASGRVTGAFNVVVDLSEQAHAQMDLARLAAIVESSDDAIVSKNLSGIITSWNAGAARIFGYTEDEIVGRSINTLIPPDLQREEVEIIAQLRAGRRIDHFETTRLTKDGRAIDVSITISPLRDASGKVVGASKIARNISERKRSEKLQRLMMDELSHRIKNTLAVVQSIGRQSLNYAKSNADFVASFGARIQSLAKTHDMLSQSQWEGADLNSLVYEVIGASPEMGDRITSSGPHLLLDSQTAIHLGMVLHELATNARKYGAFSSRNGRLSVCWEITAHTGRDLKLIWKESGGPPVRVPVGAGFGSQLIQQTVSGHGGEAFMRYEAEGLVCEIRLPLSQQAADITRSMLFDRAPEIHGEGIVRSILKGKRIFVVEDEPMVSMDLAETLTNVGCVVIGPAGNLEAAKALLERDEVDAALLDANLHGESTVALAASLTHKNKPFAFVTGYGAQGLPDGFRDNIVVTKPYSENQILSVLEALLYGTQSRSEVIQLRPKGAFHDNPH